jgi:hypothetical protein
MKSSAPVSGGFAVSIGRAEAILPVAASDFPTGRFRWPANGNFRHQKRGMATHSFFVGYFRSHLRKKRKKLEIVVDTFGDPAYIRLTNDGGDAAGDQEVRF